MPLARIVTRSREDSRALADDLRARGFEVQTKSPEETPAEAADLEIALEECPSEEALGNAADHSSERDFWVFIAPGAITEDFRPVQLVPLATKPVADVLRASQPVGTIVPYAHAEGESPAVASEMARKPEFVEETPAIVLETATAADAVDPDDLLVCETVAGFGREAKQPDTACTAVAVVPEPVVMEAPSPLLRVAAQGGRVVQLGRILRKRLFPAERLFWKIAPTVSVVAISLLLVGILFHRFLPLPAGVVWRPEEVPQHVPFSTAKPVKVPAVAKTETRPSQPAPTAKPPMPEMAAGTAPPASPQAQVAKPKRRSTYSEADVVAEDTVVRYGKRATVPKPETPSGK
jgi:hypothetical protein